LIFSKVTKNICKGYKSGEISFFLLETKKTTFFAKNAIGKRKTSKSWVASPRAPTADAHTHMHGENSDQLVYEPGRASEMGHLLFRPLHCDQGVKTRGSSESISIRCLP